MTEKNEGSVSCIHEPCNCPAEGEGESYCSDACRTSHMDNGTVCLCGHGDCGESIR